jgi:hypothetical protein
MQKFRFVATIESIRKFKAIADWFCKSKPRFFIFERLIGFELWQCVKPQGKIPQPQHLVCRFYFRSLYNQNLPLGKNRTIQRIILIDFDSRIARLIGKIRNVWQEISRFEKLKQPRHTD